MRSLGVVVLALACGSAESTAPNPTEGTSGGGSRAGGGAGAAGGGATGVSASGGAGSSGVASAGHAGEFPNAGGGTAGEEAVGGIAGAAGACGPSRATVAPWPGPADVRTLDAEDDFESDLSGLTYEEPGVLWAVNNLSSKLFRLVKSGDGYTADTANAWAAGKSLRFPSGTGAPDAEGVTLGATSQSGVYVSSERNSNDADTSRLSILRYDVRVAGTTLSATHEWDLTPFLPKVDPNAGIEAVTWVPDAYLTAHRFYDESKARSYAPADYGEHGAGLFVVGVEATGKLHAVALEHTTGAATLIASISSPFAGVMGLEFDRDAGRLWAHCDDTCDNQSVVLEVDEASGRFVVGQRFARPSGLPNSNHEGIALAPDSECSGGVKPFFWTDDADAEGFTLRQGALRCGCL